MFGNRNGVTPFNSPEMDNADGILAKAKNQIAKHRAEETADQTPAEQRATMNTGMYITTK